MLHFETFLSALTTGNHKNVGQAIEDFDEDLENLLRIRADVGARTNRIDLTLNRLGGDLINFTKLMSQNEDVDMAKAIMDLQSEENVYRASLSGGARIIQPTLADFLR